MIAFSTELLENLSEEEIAAVAAHEIAHVANGDMLTMSVLQGVVNAIVLAVTIPLWVLKIGTLFAKEFDLLMYFLIGILKFVVTGVLMFLGNLFLKAYSRKREYQADALAATIYNGDYMISALERLDTLEVQFPKKQSNYAAFKINGKGRIFQIFSTHPTIEQRVSRLNELKVLSEEIMLE